MPVLDGADPVIPLVFVLVVGFWVVALVDAVRRPNDEWRAAQQDKFPWVLLILATGTVGALLYWANARHAMKRLEPRGGRPKARSTDSR
jgi:choline-glycine betaine transporter